MPTEILNMSSGGGGVKINVKAGTGNYTRSTYLKSPKKFVFPVRDEDGNLRPTVLDASSLQERRSVWSLPFYGFEQVVIPAHYETVAIDFPDEALSYAVKRIVHLGTVALNMYGTKYLPIEYIECHAASFSIPNSDGAWLSAHAPDRTKIKFVLPECTSKAFSYLYRCDTALELEVDAPKCTIFNEYWDDAVSKYWTGNVCFPAVVSYGKMNLPYAGDMTWRFPSIMAKENNAAIQSHDGTGVLHLYLGPNLSSGQFSEYITYSSRVDIHIPAGSSTTKTTLDAAGVSYTQDYDYAADLL